MNICIAAYATFFLFHNNTKKISKIDYWFRCVDRFILDIGSGLIFLKRFYNPMAMEWPALIHR